VCRRRISRIETDFVGVHGQPVPVTAVLGFLVVCRASRHHQPLRGSTRAMRRTHVKKWGPCKGGSENEQRVKRMGTGHRKHQLSLSTSSLHVYQEVGARCSIFFKPGP